MNKRTHAEAAADLALPLPSSPDAERLCLGAVVVNDERWEQITGIISAEDFSLEATRRIFAAMGRIKERGERVHRVSLADELGTAGHLESVGGLTFLVSLDDGLPDLADVASYARIVKEKADLRRVIFAAQSAIDRALEGVGRAQEIAAAQVQALEIVQVGRTQEDPGQTPTQIVESYPGGIEAFLDPSKRTRGLLTGLRRLDDMTDGLHKGELIVIGARPGVGKSSLLLNLAENICMRGMKHHEMWIFSLEMVAASLVSRIMCSRARVDQHKFRQGYLGVSERQALHKALFAVTESKLRILDKFGITVAEICQLVRRGAKASEIACIGLDYLQLAGTKSKGENRNLEISEMTRQLKILAGDCNLPVIVLSQLSRSNEKRTGSKRPILSDLRDSGSIEQDADMVWLLHREEFYSDKEEHKGQAEVIVAKNRHGPIGTANLRFMSHLTRFDNKADDALPEEENAADPEPPPLAPPREEDGW